MQMDFLIKSKYMSENSDSVFITTTYNILEVISIVLVHNDRQDSLDFSIVK
jgi:hypothetical protein